MIWFAVVQSLSCVRLLVTPSTAGHQASLAFAVSRVCSNSCPVTRWCHPTISSSVVPFSSWPQSFPKSGSFQMSQLFASCGQRIGVSGWSPVVTLCFYKRLIVMGSSKKSEWNYFVLFYFFRNFYIDWTFLQWLGETVTIEAIRCFRGELVKLSR